MNNTGNEKPNLILIVLDTVRAGNMSCYVYEKATTPHLERFLEKGILFEERTDLAEKYKSELFNWYDALPKSDISARDEVEIDHEVQRQLQALGYFYPQRGDSFQFAHGTSH